MPAANVAELQELLPPQLWEAAKASVIDPTLPKQGCSALRTIIQKQLDGTELPEVVFACYAETISDWVDRQASAQELAVGCLDLLAAAESKQANGEFPSWFEEPWHLTLRLPWAEHLMDAVLDATPHLLS